MSIIEAKGLDKTFKVYSRGEGISGYLKSFISRDYEEVHAVRDLDLEIERGEMVGYIGPNGAGKSTTVKMMTGILQPTAGTVRVNGIEPYANRITNAMQIGVVFGQRTQLWWDLPVKESFKLLKEIYEVDDAVYKQRLEEFTEVLQLEQFMETPVRKLSLGQKMRCELAAAFLHHPPVVYLDEPTIGLDVAVKERIRDFIKRMNREEETTVLLTTHDIGDIEDLCDRIVVIDEGQKIYDGSLDTLISRFSTRRVVMEIRDDFDEGTEIKGVVDVRTKDGQVDLSFDREETSAAELMKEVLARYDVIDFQIKEPDIEAVVKRIYNEGL
jgi:ABC-2 type transport system ATP-binding protein